MHSSNPIRTFLGIAGLASVIAGAQGCVADRPSRNGVFNENQYIRKDFLVRQGPNGEPDPGWFMKATIVQTSTPNPLAGLDMFSGAENSGAIVRFAISSDRMQIVDTRELSNSDQINNQETRTPAIVNSWPITNVDLKYQINLDGEKTNFYSENQELDWQVRQWVKVNFDKNDLSDIAGLGAYQTLMLNKCADGDAATALVPNSFLVDEKNDYMQWTVSVSVPLKLDDQDCMTAFGQAGTDFLRMNRQTVTLNVMYSMARAKPVDANAYTPLVIDEKDPIRHKYGPIMITNFARDTNSGLLSARELAVRFNPNKDITFYFAKGYPDDKKDMWTRAGGIVDQTNAVLGKAGATGKFSIKEWNDGGIERHYGDVRYSFIRWESDLDTDSPFLGVTQFQPDLRTGELVSASINIADAPLKDFLAQRVHAYLSTVIGADPFSDPPPDPANPGQTLSPSCNEGDTIPLISSAVQANIYGNSTLFQKMALYLPPAPDGASPAGPSDYIYQHKGDAGQTFFQAYYKVIPYFTYADPMMNQFVTPTASGLFGNDSASSSLSPLLTTLSGETQFRKIMADIDHGQGLAAMQVTDGPSGIAAAYAAADSVRQALQAHHDYEAVRYLPHSLMRGDTPQIISFPNVVARSSRHCVGGQWQSLDDWMGKLLQSYYEGVVWHEFGHVMGLEHNFMGSVDKPNWPTYQDSKGNTQYGKMSSSIMEYSVAYDDTFWNNGAGSGQSTPTTGWLPYDQAAMAFIYGNNLSATSVGPAPIPQGSPGPLGISGQVDAHTPWNDPIGFGGATETNFLFCSHQHIKYTPLCRQFDVGSTPSEITANDIEMYEWNYKWRNFRNYYKVWDDSNYAASVDRVLNDQKKFQAMDVFDWNPAELTDKLLRVGIDPPANGGAVNAGLFYQQLTSHFSSDVLGAEQLTAAFHEAIIQQATGQRPYATTYDPYYGDVTQQGIAIDKDIAFTYWLGLWPYDNYDPSQAAGLYGSSMTIGAGQTQPAQSWSTVGSMLGEKGAWDAYPIFFPSAVALFAHDTQDPYFIGLGYPAMRDWIGGHSFIRVQDAIDYFRKIAADNPTSPISVAAGCSSFASCTYNPMTPQTDSSDIGHTNPSTGAFVGPDNRRWTWVYLADRNVYFFVDQDRNPSSYFQVFTFNQDVLTQYDDGNIGPVYSYEAKIKYMIDGYGLYGGSTMSGN